MVCGPRIRDGEHGVQLLGLLQHLPSRRRDQRPGAEYSPRNFSLGSRDCCALPGDADKHSGCGAVAGGSEFPLYREFVRGKTVRTWRGAVCDRHCSMDRPRLRILCSARLFATSVLSRIGRQLFSVFARLHPKKHFPHVSLLFLGEMAFVFSLTLRLRTVIAAILAMRLLVQFIGQAVGVILIRSRWGAERLPSKMLLYPLPAVLTMIGWAWIFWLTCPARKWGLAQIALGAVAFIIRARKMRQWPFVSSQLAVHS